MLGRFAPNVGFVEDKIWYHGSTTTLENLPDTWCRTFRTWEKLLVLGSRLSLPPNGDRRMLSDSPQISDRCIRKRVFAIFSNGLAGFCQTRACVKSPRGLNFLVIKNVIMFFYWCLFIFTLKFFVWPCVRGLGWPPQFGGLKNLSSTCFHELILFPRMEKIEPGLSHTNPATFYLKFSNEASYYEAEISYCPANFQKKFHRSKCIDRPPEFPIHM